MKRITSHVLSTTLFMALFVFGATSQASMNDFPGNNQENPNRPKQTAVLMANGIYVQADPSYIPPTADDFDTIIMGRDEHAKEERKQLAIDYFIARYGVDLSSGSADGGNIVLADSFFDPRNNLRAYKLPESAPQNRKTSKRGWIVHDRQYVMFVGALGASSVLKGSWGGSQGTVVPPGTAAVDGDYLIQGTKEFRQGHPKNIYIRFQSADPIFNATSGDIKFNCVLLNERGSIIGAAIGRQEVYLLDESIGLIQMAVQNVWQFPAPPWALP